FGFHYDLLSPIVQPQESLRRRLAAWVAELINQEPVESQFLDGFRELLKSSQACSRSCSHASRTRTGCQSAPRRGQDHDRNSLFGFIAPDPLENLQAADFWQLEIEQNKLWHVTCVATRIFAFAKDKVDGFG